MVLASYGFKRYQPLEALLWKARIYIYIYLKKPRKKNIFWLTLIWIFINKNWCFLLIHDWVIWVFHGLRLQLIVFQRCSNSHIWGWNPRDRKDHRLPNWKEQTHDIKDEGIFVYNIPPWILQDFLKFELQTTTKNRPPGWTLILFEGLNQPFTGLSSPRLTRTCLDLLSNQYLW